MHRTTIMIPERLKLRLEREAEHEHISLGSLVREALEKHLLLRRKAADQDPFLSSRTFLEDKERGGSRDVSLRHDTYLASQDVHGRTSTRLPRKED